ncbi:hypothetical protein J6A31_07585 [bacterium]|nr:hypothetical protein [bacterium]
MSDDKNVRHRFTVPAADTKVNQWIENQSNLGFSLRVLIKAFVRNYGMQDATCMEFGTEVKKRGRPSKQSKIQLEAMLSDDEEYVNPFEPRSEEQDAEPVVEVESLVSATSAPVQTVKQAPVDTTAKSVVKPVAKPAEPAADDVLTGMFTSNTSANTAPTIPHSVDEDGFVDPASLF